MPTTGAVQSSGLKEATGAIKSSAGYLWGLTVISDGINTATAQVHNASGGTLLAQVTTKFFTDHRWFSPPIVANAGLYLTLSGSNADCIVYYE